MERSRLRKTRRQKDELPGGKKGKRNPRRKISKALATEIVRRLSAGSQGKGRNGRAKAMEGEQTYESSYFRSER